MEIAYKSGKSSWEENISFAFNLIKVVKPKKLVELGVHNGDSFFAFCQAVKAYNIDTKCYGIDTFEGDDLTGYYDLDVYNKVMNYSTDNYPDISNIIKDTFNNCINLFEDSTIDILHIDGSHYYSNVKNDFEKWLPKVSKKGIILLHDIRVFSDRYGVWKYWKELKNNYITFQINNKYGLGVICLSDNLSDDFINLFK